MNIIYDQIHVTIKAPKELSPTIRTALLRRLRKLPKEIEALVQTQLITPELKPFVEIEAKP